MKMKQIKGLNKAELIDKEKSLRQKLLNMRFDHTLGKLLNTASLRQARLELARVLTALNQG